MSQQPKEDRLLSVAEACAYLGVSKTTLYAFMKDRRLSFGYLKGSTHRRIKLSDLEALYVPGNPDELDEADKVEEVSDTST